MGRGYAARRATDPGIAAAIEAALGDARSVVTGGRNSISVFHVLPAEEVGAAIGRLRADLRDEVWEARNSELLGATELDLGLRLAIRSL